MGELPRIEDYDDAEYDPYTALLTIGGEGKVLDPYPELARMRRAAPVWAVDIRQQFDEIGATTAGLPSFTALGYREVLDEDISNFICCGRLRRGHQHESAIATLQNDLRRSPGHCHDRPVGIGGNHRRHDGAINHA